MGLFVAVVQLLLPKTNWYQVVSPCSVKNLVAPCGRVEVLHWEMQSFDLVMLSAKSFLVCLSKGLNGYMRMLKCYKGLPVVSQSGDCLLCRIDGIAKAKGEEYLSAPCGSGNREKSWGGGLTYGEDIHVWILGEGCAYAWGKQGPLYHIASLNKHCNPPAFWKASVNCFH